MVSHWMSWENGVDLVASTVPDGPPNVIVHVARTVHTPVGSAAAGMIFFQPHPDHPPRFAGFVCENSTVGNYFGPYIFRDTPFETAPFLPAKFDWIVEESDTVGARVNIDGFVIETRLSELGELNSISRPLGNPLPFSQDGLEATAGQMSISVNGEKIEIYPPGGSMTGGAHAVWAPCGFYAR